MRANASRPRYFTAASFLIFLLIISLLVPVNFTFASRTAGGEQFPQSITASSSTDTTPHVLELKAVQDGDNAEPRKVSGFKLDMTNVVTAQRNSQLYIFITDSSMQITDAKIRTVSDQLIDLVPSIQENAFSLANLRAGVYTLDVITQKSNIKAAYEGILVLGQEPINPQTQTIIERQIIREEQGDGDNGDDGDNCDPSYPDDCIPSPPPDLNCGDPGIPNNFKVIGSDPHGFDRDNDGIGCESNSSNGGNNGDGSEDEDGRGECIEDNGYSLSEGSYIDEDNNAIVGSPCDPEEFCEDEGSTDPVVVDHCNDIWNDVDDDDKYKCGSNEEFSHIDEEGNVICTDLLDDSSPERSKKYDNTTDDVPPGMKDWIEREDELLGRGPGGISSGIGEGEIGLDEEDVDDDNNNGNGDDVSGNTFEQDDTDNGEDDGNGQDVTDDVEEQEEGGEQSNDSDDGDSDSGSDEGSENEEG